MTATTSVIQTSPFQGVDERRIATDKASVSDQGDVFVKSESSDFGLGLVAPVFPLVLESQAVYAPKPFSSSGWMTAILSSLLVPVLLVSSYVALKPVGVLLTAPPPVVASETVPAPRDTAQASQPPQPQSTVTTVTDQRDLELQERAKKLKELRRALELDISRLRSEVQSGQLERDRSLEQRSVQQNPPAKATAAPRTTQVVHSLGGSRVSRD